MTASPYEQLLAVQELDTMIDQLRHRHANHPIRDQIADVDAKMGELQSVVDGVEQRRHDLQREQKRLEDEISLIDNKRAQIDGKLYDGSVTATKDLLALQDEAAMLASRKEGIEDDELEIMEQVEAIEGELEPLLDTRQSLSDARSAHESELEGALAEIDSEITATQGHRVGAAEVVPGELLAHYESLRVDFGGIAVARLQGATCDGCHMTLSAVAVDQIKKLPDDAVVTCDQCGRLLVR